MIRIGVICPSEIAYRRFMPALLKDKNFSFAGIAIASPDEFYTLNNLDSVSKQNILKHEKEKAALFTDNNGGEFYESYEAIIKSPEIDAIYIPLPPALHYKWGKAALENNKHVLLEKPATLELSHTRELIKQASNNSLALHENYMFVYHDQLEKINSMIKEGKIGDIRLYRITFGFPRRSEGDFRYNKELGGGALYDAGGYTIKYASMLLGESARLVYSKMNHTDEFPVDIYGSAALVNDHGITAQIAFGMDNSYRCDLEVWGSTGTLTTGRILTAPDNFCPEVIIKTASGEEKITLQADDTFAKSIEWFGSCINDKKTREISYNDIERQAIFIDEFLLPAGVSSISDRI